VLVNAFMTLCSHGMSFHARVVLCGGGYSCGSLVTLINKAEQVRNEVSIDCLIADYLVCPASIYLLDAEHCSF